jgi:hypothetical protein
MSRAGVIARDVLIYGIQFHLHFLHAFLSVGLLETEELLALNHFSDRSQHHIFPGGIAALNARQNIRSMNP